MILSLIVVLNYGVIKEEEALDDDIRRQNKLNSDVERHKKTGSCLGKTSGFCFYHVVNVANVITRYRSNAHRHAGTVRCHQCQFVHRPACVFLRYQREYSSLLFFRMCKYF